MRRTVRPGTRIRLSRSVVLAATCLLAFVIFVRTEVGQSLDELSFNSASLGRASVLDVAYLVHDGLPVLVGVAAVAAFLGALRRRQWSRSLAAISLVALSLASTEVLKVVVLSRPDLVPAALLGNTFPSGHATAIAAGTMAVLTLGPGVGGRLADGVAAAVIVVGGSSTVVGFSHRPSDVIGAVLLVGSWLVLLEPAPVLSGPPSSPAQTRRRAPGLLRWCVALVPVGLSVGLFALCARAGGWPTGDLRLGTAYLAWLLGVLGATLMIIAARRDVLEAAR